MSDTGPWNSLDRRDVVLKQESLDSLYNSIVVFSQPCTVYVQYCLCCEWVDGS